MHVRQECPLSGLSIVVVISWTLFYGKLHHPSRQVYNHRSLKNYVKNILSVKLYDFQTFKLQHSLLLVIERPRVCRNPKHELTAHKFPFCSRVATISVVLIEIFSVVLSPTTKIGTPVSPFSGSSKAARHRQIYIFSDCTTLLSRSRKGINFLFQEKQRHEDNRMTAGTVR